MTTDDTSGLPVRPQQPPPSDLVQQQIRLLVKAINALHSAVNQTDRKHSSSRDSVAPTSLAAGELAAEVAELGGWADSLFDVGDEIWDGDETYIVGEQTEAGA